MESYFFRFVTHISIYLMIFMLKYAFTHILFSLRILLLAVEMSDTQALRSQARQIAVTDPIQDPCYCSCYLKKREDAMNEVLFAPLSKGASKLTGISNKTISRIKADSENAVLAPRKP